MDLYYINGHTFLYTKYGKVNVLSAQACTSKSKVQIMKGLDTVIKLYDARYFKITYLNRYNEFNIQTLKYLLIPALLYIYVKMNM